MRLKLLFLLSFCILWGATLTNEVHADDGIPQNCEHTEGAYYRPNLFPRFTNNDYRLVLADWTTGEDVTVLEESLPDRFGFDWSPDCRYLIGYSVTYGGCQPGVIIWDALDGIRRLALNGFCDSGAMSHAHIFWKPDNSVVLISEWYRGWNSEGSNYKRILWYPDSDETVTLQRSGGINPNFFQLYWDDARGWLWGSSHSGVTAFDIHSGQQVISFKNPPIEEPDYWLTSSSFTFSPDATKVILHGQHNFDRHEREAMTVYDIASGTPIEVNVERNGAGAVAMSPDNRYLVMGYEAIRVWDLQNLSELLEERLPIYRHAGPIGRIISIRFIDDTILEVSTAFDTTWWNLHTGEPVAP